MRVNVMRAVGRVSGAVTLLLVGICTQAAWAQVPTPTSTVTPTATPAVFINVGSAAGAPGSTVEFQVKVSVRGVVVGGAGNDITFNALRTPIEADAQGLPKCTVNPAYAALSRIGFLPSGCSGAACTGIRAVILSFGGAIPDGTVVYTCTVHIAADAPVSNSFPLACSNATSSSPTSVMFSTACSNPDGEISVVAPGGGGGGCAVGGPTQGGLAWLIFLPLVVMLWRRRSLS